jgi:hypothetical protein
MTASARATADGDTQRTRYVSCFLILILQTCRPFIREGDMLLSTSLIEHLPSVLVMMGITTFCFDPTDQTPKWVVYSLQLLRMKMDGCRRIWRNRTESVVVGVVVVGVVMCSIVDFFWGGCSLTKGKIQQCPKSIPPITP